MCLCACARALRAIASSHICNTARDRTRVHLMHIMQRNINKLSRRKKKKYKICGHFYWRNVFNKKCQSDQLTTFWPVTRQWEKKACAMWIESTTQDSFFISNRYIAHVFSVEYSVPIATHVKSSQCVWFAWGLTGIYKCGTFHKNSILETIWNTLNWEILNQALQSIWSIHCCLECGNSRGKYMATRPVFPLPNACDYNSLNTIYYFLSIPADWLLTCSRDKPNENGCFRNMFEGMFPMLAKGNNPSLMLDL